MKAKDMTLQDINAELFSLEAKLQELYAALEESGGHGGSPGEWIYERIDELETELDRRAGQ